MKRDLLRKARDYEKENMQKSDHIRPVFHATGGIGWINDPNGFSVYKGEYHLFYQYHPYSTQWGPMHWGHMKTKDFVKWERLPIAIAPDEDYDKDGCFSGSAIELDDGRQLLMYTGVIKKSREDGSIEELQHQCIAIGDGVNYEKVPSNPVIRKESLPEGASIYDFRDPKIFKEGEDLYAVIANRAGDGAGSVLLYTGKDGMNWSFVKILDASENRYGEMWECPDFLSLNGKQLLIVSPIGMTAEGLEFHNGNGVIIFGGSYDKKTHEFNREWVQSCDYGIDFYAPQTLIAPDGRRIMIGWMQNWATINLRDEEAPIFGSMTLPRELSLRGNRVYVNPVKEIEQYRVNPVSYKTVTVKEPVTLPGIEGRVIDMTVNVKADLHASDIQSYSFFKITLAKDETHGATIVYRPIENTVTIDRTRAAKPVDTVHVRSFYVDNKGGNIKFRVLMDKDSIELFVNDGEKVATFLVYDAVAADGIEFSADKNVVIDVEKYDIIVQ